MALTKKQIRDIAITAPITGYVSAVGTVTASDTLLQAIQKLNANAIAADVYVNQRINSAASNFSQSII